MKQGIIDRFEGSLAIIETERGMLKIDRQDLPANAREGDAIRKQADGWIVDDEVTLLRKEKIDKLAAEVWED
ncbi:Protein of unknown function DUF3006 [Syntrophomonas zehnderi OL-4]|uniref:DUF3006 domain-containing protein n=1 Tax=Syntrophomonas zehnderi OL-4 TaxID=690567 RepID=A0A0E3W3J2_9FIRM|nr:DUF3006 domain-containing protein [Syntrophomonas zehnderi]CFX86241.1 Protein of unknown function DUF3006 [Syntrophomonas zehnderi OL-4]